MNMEANNTEKINIIAHSATGIDLAKFLQQDLYRHKERTVTIYSVHEAENVTTVSSTKALLGSAFNKAGCWIFIGALGICVRHIAPWLQDKASDPAVLNIDEQCRYVQPVISGHQGGANAWAKKIARSTGAEPVITTAGDNKQLWALDTLKQKYGWKAEFKGGTEQLSIAQLMNRFNEGVSTALLLEVQNEGTRMMEKECPDFISIYRHFHDIPAEKHELLLAVTPFVYTTKLPAVFYRPSCFHAGIGCEKNINTGTFTESIQQVLQQQYGISPLSIAAIHTIDFKTEEPALKALTKTWNIPLQGHSAAILNTITTPNPSDEVYQATGTYGVAEPAALKGSGGTKLWLEKKKITLDQHHSNEGKRYTLALAADRQLRTEGEILIVGAGTGDPELITMKGLQAIEEADLILYAGSLIPESLLENTPTNARIRNSASMNLEEQFAIMDKAYAGKEKIVRLHSGDPSIYGAIHEQIKHFEDKGYRYEIIPGIAASQAAAALLKTEFTLPGKVQSIVLTRAAGRTPMPNKESLERFAETGSTLCIFLSAKMIKRVKSQLLEHLAPETPAAVCYRLTWPDQQIHKGTIANLDEMVRQNKLTRTVLLIAGEALTLTEERSSLYHPSYRHIFRNKKTKISEDP